jgi:hypothetical protein
MINMSPRHRRRPSFSLTLPLLWRTHRWNCKTGCAIVVLPTYRHPKTERWDSSPSSEFVSWVTLDINKSRAQRTERRKLSPVGYFIRCKRGENYSVCLCFFSTRGSIRFFFWLWMRKTNAYVYIYIHHEVTELRIDILIHTHKDTRTDSFKANQYVLNRYRFCWRCFIHGCDCCNRRGFCCGSCCVHRMCDCYHLSSQIL